MFKCNISPLNRRDDQKTCPIIYPGDACRYIVPIVVTEPGSWILTRYPILSFTYRSRCEITTSIARSHIMIKHSRRIRILLHKAKITISLQFKKVFFPLYVYCMPVVRNYNIGLCFTFIRRILFSRFALCFGRKHYRLQPLSHA